METWQIILMIILGIGFILLNLYIGVTLYVKKSLQKMMGRYDKAEYPMFISYSDIKNKYPREEYYFKSKNNLLAAFLYGKGNKKGFVVYVHGLCPGHTGYLSDIMELVNRGYEVFTYDYTGTGLSEGKSQGSVQRQAYDLRACLKYLSRTEEFKDKDIFLYGHSMGGYAVAVDVNESSKIKACVSISGFDCPLDEIINTSFIDEETRKKMKKIKFILWSALVLMFGPRANKKAHKELRKTQVPTLVVQGSNDDVVDFKNDSIFSKRSKIANMHVNYIIYEDELHNGHSNLLASDECSKYQIEKAKERADLTKKYNGDYKKAAQESYKNFDVFKANEANPIHMDKVDYFFQENK